LAEEIRLGAMSDEELAAESGYWHKIERRKHMLRLMQTFGTALAKSSFAGDISRLCLLNQPGGCLVALDLTNVAELLTAPAIASISEHLASQLKCLTMLSCTVNCALVNGSKDEGASKLELFHLLGRLTKLEELRIYASLDSKYLLAVAAATGTSLRCVDWSWNKLSDAAALEFAEAVTVLEKFTYIAILPNQSMTSLTAIGAGAIRNSRPNAQLDIRVPSALRGRPPHGPAIEKYQLRL
jgi:hypothetical protein